jgi:hypothetical protein
VILTTPVNEPLLIDIVPSVKVVALTLVNPDIELSKATVIVSVAEIVAVIFEPLEILNTSPELMVC